MSDGKRRSFSLLGRREFRNTFPQGRPARLRMPCEELRDSPRAAHADHGRRVAEAGDAVRRYSLRRSEYDALHRAADTCRLSEALLPDYGHEISPPGC